MAGEPLIGIMADSHGRSSAISAALSFFRRRGCSRIYHLGDICDSSFPQSADECVALLARHRVLAVKGNNDHTLVVNLEGNPGTEVSTETLDYLKQLPLVRHHADAVLTHALPFVEEKGLSCMIGAPGPSDFALFAQKHPQRMLFRGHQHFPEIMWRRDGQMATRRIQPEKGMSVRPCIPCIVTCGALDSGFCMLWEPGKSRISCHRYAE